LERKRSPEPAPLSPTFLEICIQLSAFSEFPVALNG